MKDEKVKNTFVNVRYNLNKTKQEKKNKQIIKIVVSVKS